MWRQLAVLPRRVAGIASQTSANAARTQFTAIRRFADDAKPAEDAPKDAAASSSDESGSDSDNASDALADAEKSIAELKDQVAQEKKHTLTVMAEMENLRKMKDRQIDDIRKYAAGDFAKHLLDVCDNFRRAADSVKDVDMENNHDLKNFYDGVLATEREMLHAFTHVGVEKMDPVGHAFDPHFHEALFEIPEQEKDGIVMQVMRDGYVIHDRCLRAAQVGVSKAAKKIS